VFSAAGWWPGRCQGAGGIAAAGTRNARHELGCMQGAAAAHCTLQLDFTVTMGQRVAGNEQEYSTLRLSQRWKEPQCHGTCKGKQYLMSVQPASSDPQRAEGFQGAETSQTSTQTPSPRSQRHGPDLSVQYLFLPLGYQSRIIYL